MVNAVREIHFLPSKNLFSSFHFMSLRQAFEKSWKTPTDEKIFRELIPFQVLFAKLMEEAFLTNSQFNYMRLSIKPPARRTPTFLQRFEV